MYKYCYKIILVKSYLTYNIWLDIKVIGIKYLARYHAGINIWKVFGYKVFGYKVCKIFVLVYKIFGYKIRFGYKVMAIKSLAIKYLAIR